MKHYRTVSVMAKINDKDISEKELISVAAPVEVDVNKLNQADEEEKTRYRLQLADTALNIGLSEVINESPSFVDFKRSIGDIEVVDFHIYESSNTVLMFDTSASIDTLRDQLSSKVKVGALEFLNKTVQEVLPAMFAIGETQIPDQVYIEVGSEYDDNNYYTDLSTITLYKAGDWNGIESKLYVVTPYGDDALSGYLKEMLRDTWSITDIEIAGLANEKIDLNVHEPTKEEIEQVKSKIFYDENHSMFVYYAEDEPSDEDKKGLLTLEEAEKQGVKV